MASYVLEGAMAAVLADTVEGKWFRENVEVMVVPFVDKDGVEDGDQGKNRKPRDHNRDYVGKSIYASTAALRRLIPKWSDGRLKAAIDLHCPWIRGRHNEVIYFVGSKNKAIWKAQCKFATILESVCGQALPYKASDNLPFGKAWNTDRNFKAGKSCARWASESKGVDLATTIEVPYANARKTTITPKSARAFGAALIEAMYKYLQTPRKEGDSTLSASCSGLFGIERQQANVQAVTTNDEVRTRLECLKDGNWRQVGEPVTRKILLGAPFTFGGALGLGSEDLKGGSQLYLDGVAVFNRVLRKKELEKLSFNRSNRD